MKVEEADPASSQTIEVGGFVREDLAYSIHAPEERFEFTRRDPHFTKIRTTLNLSLEVPLSTSWKTKISINGFHDDYYRQAGRETFAEETITTCETELELRDTFVEDPLSSNLWLKFGRQIIVWGEADSVQIVDQVNPRDSRELGHVDIEDSRLPIWSTKISYTFGDWEWNGVVLHEF